ncbi:MAG: protein kinase [Planctomycetota bacterium]|nr:protein kinase [Planctomycetota bacterium]MDW8373450.1 protein kinase [Planctomycetota bacterium]
MHDARRAVDDSEYPLIGETLGMWRLVRGLGKGGMGEVYAAEYDYAFLLTIRLEGPQRELVRREIAALPREQQARIAASYLGIHVPADAQFAIKVCNARVGTSGHRRFLQEAEVAQKLGDHPYIVTVHAVHTGLDSGIGSRLALDNDKHRHTAYIVMDLATRDWRHDRLTIPQAVHIVRCIANALDHAHAKGVVHRDLKPENILGTIEHPLLTDFGIAKDAEQDAGLTHTGQIIGTLDYMSPEQTIDAKRVDHRSDIYSLGVVLYEMATGGHLPYAHKQDRESCLAAIRSESIEPKWPREHVPDFPVALERIILKAMAHRPEWRYQSMAEFIADLDRFTRGEWVPFWGRVRPISWLRFCFRAYPKAVWGTIALALLLIGLTASIYVPRWFDAQRAQLSKQLQALEAQVSDIRQRRAQQLSLEQRQQLQTLKQRLHSQGTEDYRDLRLRLGDLERQLLDESRLEAWFGVQPPWSDALPFDRAKAELQTAARIENPAWYARGNDGLLMHDWQTLELGPYGRGSCYLLCRVRLPREGLERFRLEVREAEDPRHTVSWSIDGSGMLHLSVQEDLLPPQTIRRESLRANVVQVAMHVTAQWIRSWVGASELRHMLPGLNEGAPAVVRLELPKNAVLIGIGIWPRGPSGQ